MINKFFPIINDKESYLDNAATTQKPYQVIDTIRNYYEKNNANVHRGLYELSQKATKSYEDARNTIKEFVNAEEIIFTKNATEGFNLLANSLGKKLKKGDNIVVTEFEHHSNYLPWKIIAKEKNVEFRIAEINKEELDIEELKQLIDEKTKVLAINYVSNAIGTKLPIEKILREIKGPKIVLDASQAIPHFEINLKKLGADFIVFSGHKMYGPTGIGVIATTTKNLEELEKYQYGGSMVTSIIPEIEFSSGVHAFEAGTPNIAGAIGLCSAVEFIKRIGYKKIQEKDKELMNYAKKELKNIDGLKIIGKNQISTISFTMKNAHPHDIASILDTQGVMIRAGHHCAQPTINAFGLNSTARISFGIYNTKEDIQRLIKGLKKVNEVFK